MGQRQLEKKSPFQTITLVEDDSLDRVTLYLDGYFQFDSGTERTYHELLASLPMAMAIPITGCCCIMGGGDGLAMREVLRYPVRSVVLLELDPEMIELARRPPLSGLNESSLLDSRAHVVVGDAKETVKRLPDGSMDVIIADFPAATSRELMALYDPSFYDVIFKKLSSGGVFASQISEPPEFLSAARQYCQATLGDAASLIAQPNAAITECFLYASREPLMIRQEVCGTYALPSIVQDLNAQLATGKRVIVYRKPRRVC